jgi:hypothetical protein
MSKMADLAYDIEQLYIEGKSANAIARELNCPIELVKGWIEGNGCQESTVDPWSVIEDPHIVG